MAHTVSGLLGATAMLVAVALFLYGTFRTVGTPVPGNRPTTAIVQTVPYRYSRNPIYLAFSLLHLGVAFWVNSLWPLVTLMPAVVVAKSVFDSITFARSTRC